VNQVKIGIQLTGRADDIKLSTIIRAAKAPVDGPDSPRTVGADHRRDTLDGMKKKLGDFCHLPNYGFDPFNVINEQSIVDAKCIALGQILAKISPALHDHDFSNEHELIVSCTINGAQANLHFIKISDKISEISDGWETEQINIPMTKLDDKFAKYRPYQLVVNVQNQENESNSFGSHPESNEKFT
jgi:hypothetical protein